MASAAHQTSGGDEGNTSICSGPPCAASCERLGEGEHTGDGLLCSESSEAVDPAHTLGDALLLTHDEALGGTERLHVRAWSNPTDG